MAQIFNQPVEGNDRINSNRQRKQNFYRRLDLANMHKAYGKKIKFPLPIVRA